jgi:hypothetical protein
VEQQPVAVDPLEALDINIIIKLHIRK